MATVILHEVKDPVIKEFYVGRDSSLALRMTNYV